MKTRVTSLGVALILAFSVGTMTSCSHQGVDREMHTLGTDHSTVISLLSEGQKTHEKNRNGNGTCTYYHKGSNGSIWKTKWC